jgi:ribosomal protein S18 acetylase RimI-like enzyme
MKEPARKEFIIRATSERDREWVRGYLRQEWGSENVVTRGKIYQADLASGFVAVFNDEYLGLLTYRIDMGECEVITLNSLSEGKGIGTALLEAVKDKARSSGCRRVWLITTNDNLPALGFYQKRGFRLKAIYPDAIVQSRILKSEIPIIGMDGIPIRDEIELEIEI